MIIWKITYTILDSAQQTSELVLYVSTPSLVNLDSSEDPYDFAGYMAIQIDGMTEGQIINISLTTRVQPQGSIKTMPDTNSRVERGASMLYTTEDGFAFRHRIPTIKEGILEGDFNLAFGEYLSQMVITLDPQVEFQLGPTNNRGQRLYFYEGPKEAHRRERPG